MEHEEARTGQQQEPKFAAFVSIDWADKIHAWSLSQAGSSRIERGKLENTPEALEVWVSELNKRFAEQPIAIAIEQKTGAVVAMLSKYSQLYLYPVHPLSLAKYREVWNPSKSKSDAVDADLLLEVLTTHRSRLRRLNPDVPAIRLLHSLTEGRRKLVDERTAHSNQAKAALKIYFPQIIRWWDNITVPIVSALLEQWPTLQELKKVKPAILKKFFRQQGCGEQTTQLYLDQIQQAVVATNDEVIVEASSLMVAVWMQQIQVLGKAIKQLDDRIAKLAVEQQDWIIFNSLPGAGQAMAPRLMAAMGTDRDRFHSASEVQCFTGIAPVTEASGNSVWVHFRWACPKFIRQTFHEWAACSIPHSAWAKAFYETRLERGNSHHQAVRALAFRWIRILYACWKTRTPYSEETYTASLAKRKSKLALLIAV